MTRIIARLYDRLLEPVERAGLRERRRALLADLEGHVLEIGAGTGLGLRHYEQAERVVQLEPDAHMRQQLHKKLADSKVPVEVAEGKAEELSFEDESFDAVVSTLTLCSVDDPARALAEIERVLKPDGRLVLIEHVRGAGFRALFQDALAPLHRRLAGGCRPNRRTAEAVRAAGFDFTEDNFTLEGNPNPLTRPAIQGTATKSPD
jgi:ubiquinone/menaquinone biosynthesis C-methylase UbiE